MIKPTHDGNKVVFNNGFNERVVLDGERLSVDARYYFTFETAEQAQRLALELLVGPGGTGTAYITSAIRALRAEFERYDEERRKEQEHAQIEAEGKRLREVFMNTPGAITDVWSAVARMSRKIAQEKAEEED